MFWGKLQAESPFWLAFAELERFLRAQSGYKGAITEVALQIAGNSPRAAARFFVAALMRGGGRQGV